MDGIEAGARFGGLRVGIDGFNLAMVRGTGVATYARELARCLALMGCRVDALYGLPVSAKATPMMREVTFFDGLSEDRHRKPPRVPSVAWLKECVSSARGLDAQVIPRNGAVDRRGFEGKLPAHDRLLNIANLFSRAERHFRRTGRFLRVRIPEPPRIMHWTYPLPISVDGAINVYTIHDLVPLRLPHTTLDNKGVYMRLIRGCLAPGRHVCTVSDASRQDIIHLYPQAEGRVSNTYEAFEPPASVTEIGEDETRSRLHGLFDLPYRGYYLFFGSLEPKKNIGRLVEAYLSSGISHPLVLVGAQAWKSEQELRLVKAREGRPARDGEGRIIQIDYLPFDMLMTLIRGARAVTFPSLYEGFGLPVLEAMALGTPTLTATTGSLPEIAGDCSVLVDPYDVRSIAAGLRQLDGDDLLRDRLSAEGPGQAARFNMAAYRTRLEAFYKTILAADH